MPFGPYKGEKREVRDGCKCKQKEIARAAVEGQQQIAEMRMKRLFNQYSLISPNLQQATIESYEPKNNSQAKAKKIAERYVESFDLKDPKNLLIVGAYGIGKSHLAKGITDKLIEKGHSAVFISVPKLLTRFRDTYNKDSDVSEWEMIETLGSVNLLVLDDLGSEKQSEWAWEKLFEIVDSRQGMHTIYTTNFAIKDLAKKLGERNFSRVMNENSYEVLMDGDNHRLIH